MRMSSETEKKAARWSAAFLAILAALMTWDVVEAVLKSGNLDVLWALLLPALILALAFALQRYSLEEMEQ